MNDLLNPDGMNFSDITNLYVKRVHRAAFVPKGLVRQDSTHAFDFIQSTR